MKPLLYVAGVGLLVAVPVAAWLLTRNDDAPEPLAAPVDVALAPPPPPPPDVAGKASLGAPLAEPPPPQADAGVAVITEQTAPPKAGIGSLLANVGRVAGGAAVGGTITLGLMYSEALGDAVGLIGGNKAAQDTARVFGVAPAIGTAVQRLAESVGAEVGLSAEASKHVAQTAGLTAGVAVLGGPITAVGVPIVKGVAEGVSAAIGAVFGDGAERDVRNAVSQLDPFKTGSVANQVVSGIADLVHGVAGGNPGPPVIRGTTTEEQERLVKNETNRQKTLNRKFGLGGIDDF